MLSDARPDYARNFTPFPFDLAAVASAMSVVEDLYVGALLEGRLMGYFMLRGMGEGFQYPMLGIFVREELSGQGVGKLLLDHAAVCVRLAGIARLRLKVSNVNPAARRLYESAGYRFLRDLGESAMMELVVKP